MSDRSDAVNTLTRLQAELRGDASPETFQRIHDALRRRAVRRLGDHPDAREEAEDLVQEVWMRFQQRPAGSFEYRGPGSLLAYLTTILHGAHVDRLRGRDAIKRGGGEASVPLDTGVMAGPLYAADPTPTSKARAAELEEEILALLDGKERHAWQRRREGATDAAIAAELGVSEASVRSYVHRARELLKRRLDSKHG